MSEKHNYAYKEGIISIIINTFLFVIKLWAGKVSFSAALIADAWHTLSDSISSFVVIWGSWLSRKPADERHPFGHGRAELIAALLVGAFLAFIGYEFLLEGVDRLVAKEQATFGTIAIVVTIVSILMKELLAQYALYAYRKSGMTSIKADAWHHRSDALSSVVVLFGIVLGRFFWWIDGVLSIVIALMLFYAAYKVIVDGADHLLGVEPDEDVLKTLSDICQKVLGSDQTLHHIHQHNYGTHSELTFHIKLDGKTLLDDCHVVSSDIEQSVKKQLKMEATVHIDPIQTNNIR